MVRWSVQTVLGFALLSVMSPVARAQSLAFIRASSQLDVNIDAQRYHPLNLLDGNVDTLWCEGKPGAHAGESIELMFKTAQTVDHLRVTPSAQSGRKVESLRLSDGQHVVHIQIGAEAIDQPLSTPLHGTTFTLTLEGVGGAQTESVLGPDVACLAEISLFSGEQNLTPTQHRVHQDGLKSQLAGSWGALPLGAPESTLQFALDGTWSWVHTPLMGGATKEISGTFKTRGNKLLMRKGQSGRFIDMGIQSRHTAVDAEDVGAPRDDYDVIVLGEGLGKELAGEYNNAKF